MWLDSCLMCASAIDVPDRNTLDWPSPLTGDFAIPFMNKTEPPPGDRGLCSAAAETLGLCRPENRGDLDGVAEAG